MDKATCCSPKAQRAWWRFRGLARCAVCMRLAAGAMVASSGAAIVLLMFAPGTIGAAIGLALAALFAALFLSHAAVYVLRFVLAEQVGGAPHQLASRRRAVVGALAASLGGLAGVLFARPAFAQGGRWQQVNVACGTTGVLYTNATQAAQRLTFRVNVMSQCQGGLVQIQCGGASVGGAGPMSAGETHDILCDLQPGQSITATCPRGSGQCILQWTIHVTSTWGVTTRICGIDNDVFGNASATAEPIDYLVQNEGDCNWQPTCNGVRLVDSRTGVPFVLPPGGVARIRCVVNPGGNVLAGLCTGAQGNCVLRFKRLP
jgi:hypothetical protein